MDTEFTEMAPHWFDNTLLHSLLFETDCIFQRCSHVFSSVYDEKRKYNDFDLDLGKTATKCAVLFETTYFGNISNKHLGCCKKSNW